jgi:hypothetical protein
MVTEICVSAVFRVIVALRIRLLIFLLHGRYIPVDRSGQAPIQTFVFKTNISYDGSKETAFTAAAWALGGGGAQSLTGDYDTEVSRPESLKINVQSGIAADTLLLASYHRAKMVRCASFSGRSICGRWFG